MTTSTATEQPTERQRDQLITSPDALFNQVLDWQERGYHVMTPATRIQRFAPNWGASVSMVMLNPTVDYDSGRGTDCYFDPGVMKRNGTLEQHERGISRIGLDRIARCAGISWDPNFSVRVDTRLIMHLWEFRAVGVGMDFDGQPFTIQGTREIDLRDGSPQIGGWTPELWREECAAAVREKRGAKSINGWSDRRVLAARAHGLQLGETKAKDRAVRSLGLSHIYTVAQLRLPFVVIRATYLPDLQDPEIRTMVAEQAMRGTRALFAPQVTRSTIHAIDITPQQSATRELPPALAPDTTSEDIARSQERAADQAPVAHAAVVPFVPVEARTGPQGDAVAGGVEGTAVHHQLPQPSQTETGWRRDVAILEVKELKTGTGARGAWALNKIVLGLGESDTQAHTTLDATIASAARELQSRGDRADVLVEKDDKTGYLNVVDIIPAGSIPSIPGLLNSELPPAVAKPAAGGPVTARDMRW